MEVVDTSDLHEVPRLVLAVPDDGHPGGKRGGIITPIVFTPWSAVLAVFWAEAYSRRRTRLLPNVPGAQFVSERLRATALTVCSM